jgi:hypothetical protein
MTGAFRSLHRRLARIEAQTGRDEVEVWRGKIEADIENEATLAGDLDPLREPDGVLSQARCPTAGSSTLGIARRRAWDEIRAEFNADREWGEKGAELIFTRFAEPNFPQVFEMAMGCEADRFADLIRQQWADQITYSLPAPERYHRRATEAEIERAMPYMLQPLPRSAAVATAE